MRLETGDEQSYSGLSPRRARVICAAVVLVVAAAAWWYQGGPRIDAGHDYMLDVQFPPGEMLYVAHPLPTSGEVQLRSVSVRPIHQSGPLDLDLDVLLIRAVPGQGFPLTTADLTGFEPEPAEGAVIDGANQAEESVALVMVGVAASDVGAWRTSGIEVTYRSGIHPERTVVIDQSVCALVTPDPELHLGAEQVPAGIDPDDWMLSRSCGPH